MNTEILNHWEQFPDIPQGMGRYHHAMTAYQNKLYLFGGCYNHNYLNDLLCFDIKRKLWSKVITTGVLPSPRAGHSAVIYKSSMFVFGGWNENDLFEYIFSTKTWIEWKCTGNELPNKRHYHGAVVYSDRLWIFYGSGYTDMWNISLLSGSTHQWEQIQQLGDCPTELNEYTVTVVSNNMFALGERNNIKSLFRFNFEERKWFCLKDLPKLNHYYNLVAYEDQLFIFTHPEMYCYNLETQILSIVKFTNPLNIYNEGVRAVIIGDAMYICGYPGQLFKFQFGLNYSKICNLSTDFEKILEEQLLCDVEFLVGKEEVKFLAHIPIVVARLHWLRDMIRDKITTKDSPLLELKLPYIASDLFQMVLTYIYTDQIKLCKDIFLSLNLYELAGEIHLEKLHQIIIQQLNEPYLKTSINVSNVLDVLSKAHLLKLRFVKEFCLKFITKDSNCDEILMSNKYKMLDSILYIEILRQKQSLSNEVNSEVQSETLNLRSLKADMKFFMETFGKEFSDITLVVGENRIPAHKCILAARSKYFEALFRSFMPLDNTVRIQIGDTIPSLEAFNSLLKYIYYDEIDLPLNHLSQLVAAPSFYQFNNNNRLLEMLKMNLNQLDSIENMVEVLKAADEAKEDELKYYVLRLIVNSKPETWPRTIFLSNELLMDVIDMKKWD